MSATQAESSKTQLTLNWMGRIGGPILAVATYLMLPAEIGEAARWTAGIGAMMATFWVSEAMPLPATSLLPLAVFPILSVSDVKTVAQPYASPIIFLFIGGFMIAASIEKWGLHRRMALLILAAVGTSPTRITGGFMLASAFLSMWISNTATTVMMLPIAASVVALLRSDSMNGQSRKFEICLKLGIAYAANIGGIGTLIGTPTNGILVERLAEQGITIGFGQWMLMAMPLVVLLLGLAWVVMTRFVFRLSKQEVPGSKELIQSELEAMGPMSFGQWAVFSVCLSAAVMWIAREPLSQSTWVVESLPWITRLTDAGIAIAATIALFIIPSHWSSKETLLDWPTAVRIPWGVLILVGGGLSLSQTVVKSGLDDWLAGQLTILANLPPLAIVLAITLLVILLTEITSNTATVAILLPILSELEKTAGLPTMSLMVPATIAASCAFMLPVATPPNAIVYGSGQIEIKHMLRAGTRLNVIATLLITALFYFGSSWLLG
jgi:sodium-dependent dicarboxylate transporter 2/3/5